MHAMSIAMKLRCFLGSSSGGAGEYGGSSGWVLSQSSKVVRCGCKYEGHVGC